MKYFEFGKENKELMVMLHGGGVSYRGALPAAEYMARFYHVVLVSYDGFNPTEPDTTFRSVDYEAEMLASYINEHYDGKIDILSAKLYFCVHQPLINYLAGGWGRCSPPPAVASP